MSVFRSSLLLSSVLGVFCGRVVQEPELCCGWTNLQTLEAAPAARVRFTLQIKEKMEELTRIALDVSNPSSSSYGSYLGQTEIDRLSAPAMEDVRAVALWLSSLPPSAKVEFTKGRLVQVDCLREDAEKLLTTRFRMVGNQETKQVALRASTFNLPDEVHGSIAAVFGLHGLPLPPKKTSLKAAAAVADVTPKVIAEQYNVGGVKVSRSTKNRQAVAEFQGQTMKSSDLQQFFKQYVPGAQEGDDAVYKFVGDNGEGSAQVEASLDVQYIMGVAPGVKTEFWLYNPNDFCGDLKKWTTAMLADDDVPSVHSVSYGWQGDLSTIGCHASDSAAVESDFIKLAAKGISIIFASGDSGSGYPNWWTTGTKLYPSWPASSPWVTAVGSTRFVNQQPGGEEMATDQFGSGGGFSWHWDRSNATWQESSVSNYLESVSKSAPFPADGWYNPSGRATPDISGLGEGYQVVVSGRVEAVGGTSASTPMFAGLVSLLNEARMQNGQSRMGFLNPWLYQNSMNFKDVTQGTNAISRGGQAVKYGYNTASGWDPATGLGTPKFAGLLSAAVASDSLLHV